MTQHVSRIHLRALLLMDRWTGTQTDSSPGRGTPASWPGKASYHACPRRLSVTARQRLVLQATPVVGIGLWLCSRSPAWVLLTGLVAWFFAPTSDVIRLPWLITVSMGDGLIPSAPKPWIKHPCIRESVHPRIHQCSLRICTRVYAIKPMYTRSVFVESRRHGANTHAYTPCTEPAVSSLCSSKGLVRGLASRPPP